MQTRKGVATLGGAPVEGVVVTGTYPGRYNAIQRAAMEGGQG